MNNEEKSVHHHNTSERSSKTQKDSNPLAIPLSIIIAGGLIALAVFMSGGRAGTTAVANVDAGAQAGTASNVDMKELATRPDDHTLGNPDANIVLVEWSDLECPFCKRHHDTMNELLKEFDGKVEWVYRHYALDFHTYSKKESEASECANEIAGAKGFWDFVNNLYSVTNGNNSLDRSKLDAIAKTSNLDAAKFSACLDSGKYASRVKEDMDNGARVGVQGTPFTIAYNRKTGKQTAINGALPLSAIKAQLATIGLE